MTQLTQEMDQAVETEAGLWPVKPLREYRIPDFYSGPGEDPFGILEPWEQWWRDALERGYYLYGMPLKSAPATRVAVHNTKSARTTGGPHQFRVVQLPWAVVSKRGRQRRRQRPGALRTRHGRSTYSVRHDRPP